MKYSIVIGKQRTSVDKQFMIKVVYTDAHKQKKTDIAKVIATSESQARFLCKKYCLDSNGTFGAAYILETKDLSVNDRQLAFDIDALTPKAVKE